MLMCLGICESMHLFILPYTIGDRADEFSVDLVVNRFLPDRMPHVLAIYDLERLSVRQWFHRTKVVDTFRLIRGRLDAAQRVEHIVYEGLPTLHTRSTIANKQHRLTFRTG